MTRVLVMVLMGVLTVMSLPAEEKPLILVSNYPLQWVVETLVGDQAEVVNLTKDAENPREWVPDDAALQLLETANLVVLQGGGYETWAQQVDLSRYFDSSKEIFPTFVQERGMSKESQTLYYPNTEGRGWLDPLHLTLQTAAVAKHLEANVAGINVEEGLQKVQKELSDLQKVLTSHPRLQKERLLALDAALELTLRPAMGWNIKTVGGDYRNQEVWRGMDMERLKKEIPRTYEFFPAKRALSIRTQEKAVIRYLQRYHQIYVHTFDTGETTPPHGHTYPEIMKRNFKTLTSGYLRP